MSSRQFISIFAIFLPPFFFCCPNNKTLRSCEKNSNIFVITCEYVDDCYVCCCCTIQMLFSKNKHLVGRKNERKNGKHCESQCCISNVDSSVVIVFHIAIIFPLLYFTRKNKENKVVAFSQSTQCHG